MTLALYPWEDEALATAEQAAEDAEYEEWLTAAQEAWLDDVLADIDTDLDEPAAYVPFQDVPADWAHGTLHDEPGYAESVTPYLF